MDVTVVICTWNRAGLLDRTLERMRDLRVPAGVEWELLVVNNNCTDDTDAVLSRHAARLPLRRLSETQPGKARACNLAVSEARGDLMLWTDDDVLVDAGWLEDYVDAAHRWPQAAYFGAPIEPWFEDEPPHWIRQNLARLAMAFALYPAASSARDMVDGEAPYGANMATRRSIFTQVRFNEQLGPNGGGQLRGEETALVRAIRRLGLGGVRLERPLAQHFIPRHRLTAHYVWDYFVGHGQTFVRTTDVSTSPRWGSSPRWAVRQFAVNGLQAVVRRSLGRTDWVVPLTEAAIAWGIVTESRAQADAPVQLGRPAVAGSDLSV